MGWCGVVWGGMGRLDGFNSWVNESRGEDIFDTSHRFRYGQFLHGEADGERNVILTTEMGVFKVQVTIEGSNSDI